MFLTTKTCPKMSDKEVRGLTNYLQRDVVSDQVTSFVRALSGLLYLVWRENYLSFIDFALYWEDNLRNNAANYIAVASTPKVYENWIIYIYNIYKVFIFNPT